jgi:hypothetical protein
VQRRHRYNRPSPAKPAALPSTTPLLSNKLFWVGLL